VGNAQAVVNHIADYLHVRRDRIHLIYNGIDAGHFRSAPRLPLLAQLHDEGHRVVLNLGGLRAVKNQRLFLRVCNRLGRQFPELMFAICGDGPDRESLEAYIDELGLGGQCRLLGFHEDVAPVLAGADLLIQTSDSEGLPNAVMEAMAAGVPIVSTDVGGTRELIEDRAGGLLVPAGDEEALAARVAEVLTDPALAVRLAQESLRRIREQFSMETMVRAYVDLFGRLVAAKGRSR
jgi:glycosyltransferase involved in cell wall biosynthesis